MIDKDLFLKALVPEAVVSVQGVGEVRVRGLSRGEVLSLQALRDDLPALEQRILVLGLVEPSLGPDEVAAWYEAAPSAHVDVLTTEIARLSGMAEGAAKSGVPGLRG